MQWMIDGPLDCLGCQARKYHPSLETLLAPRAELGLGLALWLLSQWGLDEREHERERVGY